MQKKSLLSYFMVFASTLLVLSQPALANSRDALENTVNEINQNVSAYNFQNTTLNSLSVKVLKRLTVLAIEDSQGWADGILSGDYASSEAPIVLRKLEAVTDSSGSFKAYRLTYSQKAWDTSTCEYSYEDYENQTQSHEVIFKDCQVGAIIGTAYIDQKLKTVVRDYDNIEYFE